MFLIPIGDFPEALLRELSRAAGIPVASTRIDLSAAYHPARAQYDSTRLLAELKARCGETAIGVTAYDLFVPVLTYVFGEAEMPGRVAVFSIHRLREEFYGLPPNPDLLLSRALRELRHELGHLRGLAHCYDAACVMSASHSIEQVDAKDDRYCAACRSRLPE